MSPLLPSIITYAPLLFAYSAITFVSNPQYSKNAALSLYATASSVSLKVNSADVTTALNLKENLINKTLDVSVSCW